MPLCACGSLSRLRSLRGVLALWRALKAGRDAAIDVNQVDHMLAFGLGHEREYLSHDEDPDVQNILADWNRQAVFVAHDGVYEDDPETTIVQQCIIKIGRLVSPGIKHLLELCRSEEQQPGLKRTWLSISLAVLA